MSEFESKRKEAVHRIISDGYFNCWLVEITINPDTMTIDFDDTMKSSVYVHGGNVNSAVAFAPNQLLLAVQSQNVMLIVNQWTVVHQTDVSGETINVSESLLIPGFNIDNFPVIMELGKYSYNVINVLTGNRDVLIRASAINDVRQNPIYLKDLGNGSFSIDFAVARLNEIDG